MELGTEFYERLKALGCVPCAECDGSYVFPDHVMHRRLCDGRPTGTPTQMQALLAVDEPVPC